MVVMNSSILWDLMPCSLLKVNLRFGGICRLHVQGRGISRQRNQRESRCIDIAVLPFKTAECMCIHNLFSHANKGRKKPKMLLCAFLGV